MGFWPFSVSFFCDVFRRLLRGVISRVFDMLCKRYCADLELLVLRVCITTLHSSSFNAHVQASFLVLQYTHAFSLLPLILFTYWCIWILIDVSSVFVPQDTMPHNEESYVSADTD